MEVERLVMVLVLSLLCNRLFEFSNSNLFLPIMLILQVEWLSLRYHILIIHQMALKTSSV
jgi:hypothetical protein